MYSPPQHHAANDQQPGEHPAEKENKNGFWEKAGDDPVAYFTLWLVGFTGVLAVSTIGLWIVTWRASASQARDMRRSIEVAVNTAEAAHDANRPWIEAVITEKREFHIRPELARVGFKVSLRNKGNSPATAVTARAVLVAVPESEPATGSSALDRLGAVMDYVEDVQPNRGISIFPGVELPPQPYGSNIFRERLEEAAGGFGKQVRFWVAIGVRYKFGNREGQTIYAYLMKFPGRKETFATNDIVQLGPDEFELAGMALEYAT